MPNIEPALPPPVWHEFDRRGDLTAALADHLAGVIHQAVTARGRAGLVLSGGTTPADLYTVLAQEELPWNRVVLTLSDERWVDLDDAASNEAMLRRTLAPALARGATLLGLKSPGALAGGALDDSLSRLSGFPAPADLVLLGMGEDGHTASLFPGGEGVDAALAGAGGLRLAPVVPAGGGTARISLTLPALLDAREIALLVTGPAKRAVLETALTPGPVALLPVRGVLHQDRAPVGIWWAP